MLSGKPPRELALADFAATPRWEHVHLVGHYRVEGPVITGELRPLRVETIA